MKKLMFLAVFIPVCVCAISDNISNDPCIEKIISNYNGIVTIAAGIKQQIYLPGGEVQCYSGDYCADNSGNLRINYHYPDREIVINNSEGFFWYYPDRKVVYVKRGKKDCTGLFNPSIGKIIEENSSNISVINEGKEFYSFFKRAAVYAIKSKRNSAVIKIWIDPDRCHILRKYVFNSDGYEIMREIYSGHVYAGGACIPSKVEVYARTETGTVHTYTEYSNISVNCKLNNDVFVFKKMKDVESRDLEDMQ